MCVYALHIYIHLHTVTHHFLFIVIIPVIYYGFIRLFPSFFQLNISLRHPDNSFPDPEHVSRSFTFILTEEQKIGKNITLPNAIQEIVFNSCSEMIYEGDVILM